MMQPITSIVCRMMRDGEADRVAELIRELPLEYRPDARPLLTGDALRKAKGLAEVTVVASDQVLGACLWTMTYSSWRAMPGIYISDLVVAKEARNMMLGERLLRQTIRFAKARGAGFIKMEVDVENHGAERFYNRLGFKYKDEDRFFVLEPDGFAALAGE